MRSHLHWNLLQGIHLLIKISFQLKFIVYYSVDVFETRILNELSYFRNKSILKTQEILHVFLAKL